MPTGATLFRPGEILVKFKRGTSREEADEITKKHGGRILTWNDTFPELPPWASIWVGLKKENDKVVEFSALKSEVDGAWLNIQAHLCSEI